jgi:hypothetical protein
MTRLDLLKILVGQARTNGFEFRRWYTSRLGLPWISADAAITLLDTQRRYYALLFSHEFAQAFWKAGTEITFQVPAQTFTRILPGGNTATVTRKSFTRRTARPDVWRYHLREMALAEEPLRYMRKYLNVEDELEEDPDESIPAPEQPVIPQAKPAAQKSPTKRQPRPLPTGLPDFLKRPYISTAPTKK